MKLVTFSAVLLLTTAPAAYAGSDHDHGHSHGGSTHSHGEAAKKIDDKGAIAAASKNIAALIEQKKPVGGTALDATWATTTDADKKISKKGNGYYVVSFAGKATKTLYVLLSDTGELYDANYSGKFEGLKE